MTRSNKVSRSLWCAILLFGAVCVADGQSISLSSIDVKENTIVDFQAHANGVTAIAPTCGLSASERVLVCPGAARLEVKRGHGWVNARPRFEGAVLGGIGGDHKTFAKLEGLQTTNLEFVFSKDFFGVQKGTYLRIAFDIWPNEAAFRAGKAPATILSGTFRCP